MNVKTKKIILTFILIASIITIIGMVSYAYFTATGASTNQTATISTAKVSAEFADADTGANATLNFGESFTKKFTITNNGNVPAHVKMYWKDLVNTYTKESLSYTLSKSATGDNASYTVFVGGGETKSLVPQSETASTKLLASDIEVPIGTTYYELTVTLNYLVDVNQDSDLTASFYSWFELQDINYKENLALQTLQALKLTSNGTRTEFDNSTSTDEGIFEMEDDYGTSYYFRGTVENNYVRFGTWANITDNSDRAGKSMFWRIIRVNGDGSLRMIYAGTQAYANGSQGDDTFIKIGQQFNALSDDAKYVGYMYSPANVTTGITTHSTASTLANPNEASSDIKVALEEWYANNLEANYGQYISKDTIFCYDRSTPGKDATGLDSDTGLGYGTNYVAFGATARTGVWNSATTASAPTFKCTQSIDKFTSVGANTGNRALSKPIGLITADEVLAAGSGKSGTKSDYYLKRSAWYWSGSPNSYDGRANVFRVDSTGSLSSRFTNSTAGRISPVISLTAEYTKTLIGTGTIDDFYRDPMTK